MCFYNTCKRNRLTIVINCRNILDHLTNISKIFHYQFLLWSGPNQFFAPFSPAANTCRSLSELIAKKHLLAVLLKKGWLAKTIMEGALKQMESSKIWHYHFLLAELCLMSSFIIITATKITDLELKCISSVAPLTNSEYLQQHWEIPSVPTQWHIIKVE